MATVSRKYADSRQSWKSIDFAVDFESAQIEIDGYDDSMVVNLPLTEAKAFAADLLKTIETWEQAAQTEFPTS